MLRTETVSEECLALLKELMKLPWLDEFRLVGDTCLSLQYGHCKSIDIDLFTDAAINFEELEWQLVTYFGKHLSDSRNSAMGIFAVISGIKTDLINMGSEFSFNEMNEDGIRMANPLDIAAMKLTAISSRKAKKDFFDITFLLDHFSLLQITEVFNKVYYYHDFAYTMKELINFDSAENQADPEMLIPLTWEQAKEKITSAVDAYWKNELTKP
jgi:Nucleotidyl transferase AbiEii toxin, Type IV TA system